MPEAQPIQGETLELHHDTKMGRSSAAFGAGAGGGVGYLIVLAGLPAGAIGNLTPEQSETLRQGLALIGGGIIMGVLVLLQELLGAAAARLRALIPLLLVVLVACACSVGCALSQPYWHPDHDAASTLEADRQDCIRFARGQVAQAIESRHLTTYSIHFDGCMRRKGYIAGRAPGTWGMPNTRLPAPDSVE